MTEGSTTSSANLAPRPSRAVEVDGWLGRELPSYALRWLMPSQLGSDAFTEVYVETASGNTYAILEHRYLNDDNPLYKFLILNSREMKEAHERGEKRLPAKDLTDEDIRHGELAVGQPFRFSGGNTSEVRKITAVNSNRYQSDLDEITAGQKSSVRSDFWAQAGLKAPQGSVSGAHR